MLLAELLVVLGLVPEPALELELELVAVAAPVLPPEPVLLR